MECGDVGHVGVKYPRVSKGQIGHCATVLPGDGALDWCTAGSYPDPGSSFFQLLSLGHPMGVLCDVKGMSVGFSVSKGTKPNQTKHIRLPLYQ